MANIRRLRCSDREDIMEISRHVWEGNDYLPSVVDQWLQSPNSRFYGVEVESHVVAVGNLELIENGRTGWMEGLRVHPGYRGMGLANDLTQYIVETAKQLGVQRLRYTTSARNVASLKLAKMAGFSRILRMAVSWQLSPRRIQIFKDCPTIRSGSSQRACSLLEADSHVVPHGILVYDWKAVDNTCQNLEEIGRTHTFYVAAKREKIDSFSFGHIRQEPNRTWSFTAYATDSNGFLSQVSHNATIAMKKGLSSIACTYETKFEKTLNKLDLGSEEPQGTQLVLLEKKMSSQ